MSVNERNEKLLERFEKGTSVVLAMRDVNKLIGVTIFGKSFIERYPEDGEISAIYLHHDCIGKGYGQALLSEVERRLNKLEYAHFVLDVLAENKRAISFYLPHGYEKVTESSIRLGEKDYPLILFRKANPIILEKEMRHEQPNERQRHTARA